MQNNRKLPASMDGSRIIPAAHRGGRKRFPENTMPAFKAAIPPEDLFDWCRLCPEDGGKLCTDSSVSFEYCSI